MIDSIDDMVSASDNCQSVNFGVLAWGLSGFGFEAGVVPPSGFSGPVVTYPIVKTPPKANMIDTLNSHWTPYGYWYVEPPEPFISTPQDHPYLERLYDGSGLPTQNPTTKGNNPWVS